jgi:hypothetical protein
LDFGLERIAASAPTAVVIARAVSEVEVAVGFALFASFPADPGEQLFALVVVAGSEALGIVVVDQTVSVVIDAVSAIGDTPVALDDVTLSRAVPPVPRPPIPATPPVPLPPDVPPVPMKGSPLELLPQAAIASTREEPSKSDKIR